MLLETAYSMQRCKSHPLSGVCPKAPALSSTATIKLYITFVFISLIPDVKYGIEEALFLMTRCLEQLSGRLA
jgi:hypothetical protein